jgi:hypothetical protein
MRAQRGGKKGIVVVFAAFSDAMKLNGVDLKCSFNDLHRVSFYNQSSCSHTLLGGKNVFLDQKCIKSKKIEITSIEMFANFESFL